MNWLQRLALNHVANVVDDMQDITTWLCVNPPGTFKHVAMLLLLSIKELKVNILINMFKLDKENIDE